MKHRHARLHDAELLERNLFERVAENSLMVVPDRRHVRRERSRQHVRRIEAAAATDLPNDEVRLLFMEIEPRHDRQQFELRQRLR